MKAADGDQRPVCPPEQFGSVEVRRRTQALRDGLIALRFSL
jgi:hypothetical protein